jgi:hypothetical protein
MHETLEKLYEIEKNLQATYLSGNNSWFSILAWLWLLSYWLYSSTSSIPSTPIISYFLGTTTYFDFFAGSATYGTYATCEASTHGSSLKPILLSNNCELIAVHLNTSWVFDLTIPKHRNLYIGNIVHFSYIIYNAIIYGTLACSLI